MMVMFLDCIGLELQLMAVDCEVLDCGIYDRVTSGAPFVCLQKTLR